VDLLEAADRRTVEGETVREDRLVERLNRDREKLHYSRQIAKTDVNELDVLVLDIPEQFIGIGEQHVLLAQARRVVSETVAVTGAALRLVAVGWSRR
jgi:hypothetical protein